MANHAYVRTKKKMTPEAISELVNRLNKDFFHNCLEIEYSKSTKENPGWGAHTWVITAKENGEEFGGRVFWLNNSKFFEIRHGGGSEFIWWIDSSICREVAKQFDGVWRDDADNKKTPLKPIGSFKKYVSEYYTKKGIHPLELRWRRQQLVLFAPPSFWFNLGKYIKISSNFLTAKAVLSETDIDFTAENRKVLE